MRITPLEDLIDSEICYYNTKLNELYEQLNSLIGTRDDESAEYIRYIYSFRIGEIRRCKAALEGLRNNPDQYILSYPNL